jgi:hypothetical protein
MSIRLTRYVIEKIAKNKVLPIFVNINLLLFAVEKVEQKFGLLMLFSQYLAKVTIAQQSKILPIWSP